jgi:hypothetical protein
MRAVLFCKSVANFRPIQPVRMQDHAGRGTAPTGCDDGGRTFINIWNAPATRPMMTAARHATS